MNKAKRILTTAAKIILPLALFTVVLLNYEKLTNLDVRRLIDAAPSIWAAAGMVLGLYAVKGMVFVIPASLVYISVGMAFSTPVAVALNCAGIAIEVTVSYLLGRFLGGDKVDKMLRDKKGYATLEKFRSKGRFAFVFLLRFSSFPIDFGSLFFGASGFSFPSYFLMSLLGILPRVIVMTILGYGIYELIPMKYIILAVLCALPVAAVVLVVGSLKKKKAARAADDAQSAEQIPQDAEQNAGATEQIPQQTEQNPEAEERPSKTEERNPKIE